MSEALPDREYLREVESTVTALVREAGRIALRYFHLPLEVEFKKENLSDPVTQADKAVEEFLKTEISRRYPDHGILGEEGTQIEVENRDFLWALDPVDGTTNFMNGLPLFGSSAGLLYRGRPVVGAIYVPVAPRLSGRNQDAGTANPGDASALRDAVLHARLDGGTFMDSEEVHTSSAQMPEPSSLVGLPGHHSRQFRRRERMRKSPGELRCLGSVSYETAMVACGVFRYSIFRRPWLWDVAAGVLLVKEAGGSVMKWNGEGWDPFVRFEPMSSPKDPKELSLRHWNGTVLIGGSQSAGFVAERVRPGRSLLSRIADTVGGIFDR